MTFCLISTALPQAARAALSVPLAAFCLASLSAAQTLPNLTPVLKEQYLLGWPGALGSGEFGDGVIVETHADQSPDAFILRNDTLVRIPECGLLDSFETIATGVNDVCAVPDGAISSGVDAVAYARTSNIKLLDYSSGSVVVSTVDPILGASQIRAADIDGSPGAEIVALDTTNAAIRIYGEGSTGWTMIASIALPDTALDFDLANLDDKPGHELVVALPDGFEAYEISLAGPSLNQIISRRNTAFTLSQVEVLRNHVSEGEDGLAWATRLSTTGSWVIGGAYLGAFQPVHVFAPGVEIIGMESGSLNMTDKRDDLVVSFADSSAIVVYENQVASVNTAAFSNVASYGIDTTFSGTNINATPLLGDTDGDGVADVLLGGRLPVTQDPEVQILYRVDENPFIPTLQTASLDWANVNHAGVIYAIGYDDENEVQYAMHLSVTSSFDLETIPASLVVDIFEQPSPDMPIDPSGVSRCTNPGVVSIGPASLGNYQLSFEAALSALGGSTGKNFIVRIRPDRNLSDGTRPVLLLGIGIEGFDPSPPSLINPALVHRLGANIECLNFYQPANGGPPAGVGIVLEHIPLKRIKPPLGLTPATINESPTLPVDETILLGC